jgi:PST family polysaccharide transporter
MTPLAQLRAPSTTVALPVLARLQDDQERYDRYLRRGQTALGYTLVAGMAVASGAAEPLVAVALGDQWGRAVPLVTLLALAGAMETLPYVANWVYLSRGLTGPLLRFSVLSTVLKVGCIVIGSNYGIVGVAAGLLVGSTLNWPLSLWRVSRVTTVDLRSLLLGAARMLLLALMAAAVSRLVSEALQDSPAALRLAAAGAAAVAGYGAAACCFRVIRRDLRELLEVATALRTRTTSGR